MIICPICQKQIVPFIADPDDDFAEGVCQKHGPIPNNYSYKIACFVQTNNNDLEAITNYQLNLMYRDKMYGFDSDVQNNKQIASTRLYILYADSIPDHPAPALILDLPSHTPLENALTTFHRLVKLKAFL